MSLFSKIKSLLGRGSSARPPVSDQGEATPVSEPPAIPPHGNGRDGDSGLKNSIARGAAEGTARETVRKFFEELLGD